MNLVVTAFFRSLVSQLHPRMLGLLVLPFVVALVAWLAATWWVWDPLNDFLRARLATLLAEPGWGASARALGLERIGAGATAIIGLILLAPLMAVLGMVSVAVFAMPMVNRHLARTGYADVDRRGGWSIGASVATALGSFAVFAAGYLLSLPLWLVPVLGLLVPWFWWSWLTARVMRFDSLVEHATEAERKALIARYRWEYLWLGMLVSALNYVPPLFLVTPVLSALAFGHLSLGLLRVHRAADSTGMTLISDGENLGPNRGA